MIIALQTLVFFRETLFTAVNRIVSPYYKSLRGTFSGYNEEDEEEDEEVFAEFDDEKGVVFYPPMYAQRYAAVSDCLMDERWSGKLAKVVDLGYHDMSFIKYLKELPGVECILGVDIESIPLRCSSDLFECTDYAPKRDTPLHVTLFQGNAADPDFRLIGCDAVVAIEMIEHMLPHDLDRLVHTIFGFIKPWVVIITTPNGDFNELFKSLKKNGLRRLDHFFEWTREQFHDWCSNIITRYPQFEVTCQGIGPGPPGTEHLGCCSQLALFVNKNYVKQQDLNPGSLALVPNVPSPQNLVELVDGWESPVCREEKNASKENMDSLTNILYSNKQSCVTLFLSSPAFTMTSLECHDKTSQCNLDKEVGQNFIMFNDEDMYFTILIPRRKVDHRVYEIEDVNSRLNCTNFQVRKFSKTTQNLMAKNRIESLAHTREVVDEIQHLTKMLNYKRDALPPTADGQIWKNFNWGDNAPYWNQYFEVVRSYNYPFEQKSEECRIVELISEEINRLLDSHHNEDMESPMNNKLEIPIEHLMEVVAHITTDVDRVKDLLEWNGYEVAGNFLIHSRLVIDNTSVGSWEVDWPEDNLSELDTDMQSTTVSDGSALVAPDFHGRCIRRALDKKVQSLRAMLSADADITSELDRVVCKLMKLALRSSKGKQEPPPAKWMQCKLLDLLTLTEKAISRRKKHLIENFPMESNEYHALELTPFNKPAIKERFASETLDHYNNLFPCDDSNMEMPKSYTADNERSTSKGKTLIADEILERRISSPDSSKCGLNNYFDQSYKHENSQNVNKRSRKRTHRKITNDKPKHENNICKKKSKTVGLNNSSHTFAKASGKNTTNDFGNHALKTRRAKDHKKVQPTASKPIPGSLIELCDPEVNMPTLAKNLEYTTNENESTSQNRKETMESQGFADVAATEESVLIDIIMDDMEETIALKRSIGTDADMGAAPFEVEPILGDIVTKNPSVDNKLLPKTENVQSQTIFLYDINEPSTSKGVRHIGMDVQCGTDTVMSPPGLVTPHSSPTRLSKPYSSGIRIQSPIKAATEVNSMEFGTWTDNIQVFDSGYTWERTPSIFSKGIKIQDSQVNLHQKKSDFGTSTVDVDCTRKFMHSNHIARAKIKDSLIGMRARKCSDFGMSTNGNIELQSQETKTAKSFKQNGGISIHDSQSELLSGNEETEELTCITPRSSVNFTSLHADDSLSNLLINFSTDYPRQKSPVRTFSPDSRRSRDSSNSFRIDIQIKKSSTEASAKNTADSNDTSLKDEINKISESPIIYTRVKMIDLVNDVTIEQETAIEPSPFTAPEPCKLVTSRNVRAMPPNSRSKTRTSSPRQLNKYPDFSSYIDSYDEEIADKTLKSTIPKKETNEAEPTYEDMAFTHIDSSRQTVSIQNDASFDMCRSSSPTKNFGFRVKDSEENVIKKVEFSTTRVELMSEALSYWPPTQINSHTKTNTLKSLSSKTKMVDSTSEFCGSICCSSPNKSLWHVTLSSQSKQSSNKDGGERSHSLNQPHHKLSCGGVHIHSFKEKQTSEDILYQGQWEHRTTKRQRKQHQPSTFFAKKVPEASYKTKIRKASPKVQIKMEKNIEKKVQPLKPLQVRNTKSTRLKQTVISTTEQFKKVALPNLVKVVKPNSKTKVASKIAKSSITSKNVKSFRNAKKLSNLGMQLVKNDCAIIHEIPKRKDLDSKYLPPYLRKKYKVPESKLITETVTKKAKDNKVGKLNNYTEELKSINNETIKNDLLELQNEPRQNISYMVFRNEIDKSHSPANTSQAIESNDDNINRKRSLQQRSSSPMSQTSSTCSTSDSIATVRAIYNWTRTTRRQSTISNRSSVGNTDSEASPTNRNRKFSKRGKIIKKNDGKDYNNKENNPESSKLCTSDKECLQNVKSSFLCQNKNVFMAQLKDSGLALNSKHHSSTKSNIKIPAIESIEDKRRPKIVNVSKKKSLQSHNSSYKEEMRNRDNINSDTSNMLLLIDSYHDNAPDSTSISQHTLDEVPVLKTVNSHLLKEWLEQGRFNAMGRENTENAILAAMRQIVEERLDFIGNSLNESAADLEDSSSIKSCKTVVPSGDTNLINTTVSDLQNELNFSLDADVADDSYFSLQNTSGTNIDFMSFKSDASASKYAESYVAEKVNSGPANCGSKNKLASSVLDIFERKNVSLVQNPPGVLAVQAFSGFSMNVDREMGDQPEYITAMNSEHGSFGVDVTRQATSEEMFISGRSSDTYESCVVEDDVAVPDWLFHVMNPHLTLDQPPDDIAPYDSETGSPAIGYERRHVEENSDQHELVPLRMPMVEPVFDANGNVLEPGIGFGTGAGDGRGMHSDHSQDSSGRGSSLSSTDASSGPQSEAILLDPTAFTTQYEVFHEPVGSSMAVTTLVVPIGSPEPNARQGRTEGTVVSTSRNVVVREIHPPLTSDGEADVSSTDTDVPDSS